MLAETVESLEHAGESTAARKATKKELTAAKRAAKRERKATRKAAKAAAKATKKAVEEGTEAPGVTVVAKAKEPRITVSKARNAINVGKVVGPAVLPVVMPYLVRAAGAGRAAYDRHQARKLGVSVDALAEYSGHGAALHARIAGLSEGLRDMRSSGDAAKVAFSEQTHPTLEQLSAATRAAERMPSARRKQAHRAVAGELDELENRLLRQLGV
ncbi:MAG: DUF6474 family protein [Thermocrispum sp.]